MSRQLVTLLLGAVSAVVAWQGQVWGVLAVLLMLAVALPIWSPSQARPSGLTALLSKLLPVWARQIATTRRTLDAGTGGLLGSFGGIQAACETLRLEHGLESAELDAACESALQQLQFADRMGQQLGVIEQDVLRLLSEQGTLADADEQRINEWLEQLSQRYTTDEQRTQHATAAQAPPPAQGVDFF